MKHKVIFIVGPTAIGKSSVALELAKLIKGEIISADSMQVYKEMSIISQRPSLEWMEGVPHHLMGVLDVKKEYSAADFKKRAGIIIRNIIKRKHIPIVVGGSGLYIKALIDGLFPSKPKDEAFRKKLYKLVKKHGNEYLYDKLKIVDPEYASKIHLNDLRRIVRALEVFETSKATLSSLKPKTVGIGKIYDVRQFGLNMDRDMLYKKINERVELMFQDGLMDEARNILKRKPAKTVKAAIGLKEMGELFKKKLNLESAKELIKLNTRHFAKRQLTWFRPDKRVEWIAVDGLMPNEVARLIAKKIL